MSKKKAPQPASADTNGQPARRRNRTRQREELLAWLRDTDTHPTAAQIYDALADRLPSLSLGTVYRNLEVLVAEGEVVEVATCSGPARYDANLEPHHHFTCDDCGCIVDVSLPVPRGLAKRLAGAYDLAARRICIDFYGLCGECTERSAGEPKSAGV